MSLPRFVVDAPPPAAEGALVTLGDEQARHLGVLRLKPGAALELLLPEGPWKADLAELSRHRALARLVAPLGESREAPVPILACVPVMAQLSLVDDLLPPVVELGATEILPVVYARSEFDPRKTVARLERWRRIIASSCEQSHRGRVPALRDPRPFEALLAVDAPQKWVAFELPTGEANPALRAEGLAITSGPEGGITEGEFEALRRAGWRAVSLGPAILRAVTAPAALLGAVQFALAGLDAPASSRHGGRLPARP
ncbi:MAG: RsmE family RNA methyltransferase [Holophagaceae bacterium]